MPDAFYIIQPGPQTAISATMLSVIDLSTNPFSKIDESTKRQLEPSFPIRHPELSFEDGNIAVLAGAIYFLVHQGLLSRHSAPLRRAIEGMESTRFLEGRPVLELAECPNDVLQFLLALYDGISTLKCDVNDFGVVSAILHLTTTYQVSHLRADLLRRLSSAWPKTLAQWELREAKCVTVLGVYEPRSTIPHPILVINLARAARAPELLPAAFYDLSRSTPSECATGYTCPLTSRTHHLSDIDLLSLLRGKEHGSRFLSTFIVNELEGKEPSLACIYRMEMDPARKRICQSAFEAITFEILHDINGTVCQRSSDPLFAIMDSELMQTRDDPSGRLNPALRACEFCRSEFGVAVDNAREEFWQNLPSSFGIDPQVWA